MQDRTGLLVRSKFQEYLLPTILTSMAISLASVVDGILVGNLLGGTALAAVGLTSPVIYGLNAAFFLFSVGGVTCASVARGERDERRANSIFTLCLLSGMGVMLYQEDDPLIHERIDLTKKLAQGMTYSHQLGFNITVMRFDPATDV